MEEQVRRLGQLVESTNLQLRTNSIQLREANATKSQLESELKDKEDLITTFSKKLERKVSGYDSAPARDAPLSFPKIFPVVRFILTSFS